MADGLGVVPHMGAASVAAAPGVIAALPAPQPAVPLPQDRGGFQNGEVGAHRLQDLRRQRGGKEGLGELPGGLQEARPVLDQIRAELLNGGESSRVPGGIALLFPQRDLLFGPFVLRPGDSQTGFRHIPAADHGDGLLLPGHQGELQGEAAAGVGEVLLLFPLLFLRFSGLDIVPQHGQGVEPPAPEQGGVHPGGAVVDQGAVVALLPGGLLRAALAQNEAGFVFGYGGLPAACIQKVHGGVVEHRVLPAGGIVAEAVLQEGRRVAGIVRLRGRKGAPRPQPYLQGEAAVGKVHLREGERGGKRRLPEAGQAVGRAVQARPLGGSGLRGVPFQVAPGPAEDFVLGHLALDDAADGGLALYGHRGEQRRLQVEIRLILEGEGRESARALHTEGPCA